MEQEQAGAAQAVLPPEELERLEALRQELLADEQPGMAGAIASDIGTGIKEAPGQIVRGAMQAVNETSNTTYGMAEWLNDNVIDLGTVRFGSDSENGWVDWVPGMPEQNNLKVPDAITPGEADSTTGKLVEGVAQFTTGFVTAGRYLKAVGLGGATTVGGRIATGMAQGAIADATAFDPHEARLSNLVESVPALQNPVTEFLSAKDDDSEAMGRFKNAIEGLGLGAVVEGLTLSLRALRATRSGQPEEAARIIDELDAKSPPEAEFRFNEPEQIEMDLPGGGPGRDSPRETITENPGAELPPLKPKLSDDVKPVKKLIEMDEAAIRDFDALVIREEAYGAGRNIAGIRTDLIENGEDINSIMSSLHMMNVEQMQRAQGGKAGVRSHADVQRNADRIADMVGGDSKLIMQRMAARQKDLLHLDAEMRVAEDLLTTSTHKTHQLAEILADPMGRHTGFASRAELAQAYAKHVELSANIQALYLGSQTNIARALGAMKMGGRVRKEFAAGMNPDDMFHGGMKGIEAHARKVVAGGANPKNVLKATKGGFVNNLLSSVNEYWVNAILSGPKTHLVNVGSSLVTAAFLPAERMLAGALRAGTPGGRQQMMEAGLEYVGMVASFRDAVSMASKSFKLGDAILDPSNTTYELRHAISSANYGVKNPAVAAGIDGFGTVARMPSRFLTTEDEFIKQMTYRGQVRAKAYREGLTSGLWREPKKFAAHVSDALDNAVSPSGMALDQRKLENARSATFTNNLAAKTWSDRKTFGESLQRMSENHPTMRLVMPFVRTPTNIMRFTWNRTPGLNMLRKQYADDLFGKNGPEARAQAGAMMATGTALWGAAISYVSDGTLTGAGPRDPELQRQLRGTGWQPYSVKSVNDDGSVTYTAYNRADPYGMFFGLSADFAEVMGHHPEQTREEMAMGFAIALARNLTNKSYLAGVTNALNALSEPDRRGARYVQNFAGSFVPAAVTQTLRDDPYMREVRSVMDAIHARTPGFSQELDPVRNVLGQKVVVPPAWGPDFLSPIQQNSHAGGDQPLTEEWKRTPQSDVTEELSRQMFLENSAMRLPPKMKDGVDLTQYRSEKGGFTAYDRWQELTGTVKIGGRTLAEELSKTINGRTYRDRMTDGDTQIDGSRADRLRTIIGAYRAKAEDQLRREDRDLDLALKQARHKAALAKVQSRNSQ